MSATPSKLFVGFIGLILSVCLFSGLGIAEQTPGKESHVVLEVGTRGSLPCHIQTKAYLVQWKRQLISEHLLVYLDPHCNGSAKAGPGYNAELFDITDDYSLIIKDVKVRNEGLYICEVLDFQTGKVFRNRTRVSVQGHGIGTEAHVVLQMGARGILPCRILWRAYTVNWKRQLSSESELLVSLDTYFKVGARDGPGYKAGLFNITDDYSLVIKDVKVQDEGLYFCTFSDYRTGKKFRNGTRVSVQAFPAEPFPTIQECNGRDENSGVCILTVNSTSTLTCLVEGYYPDIDLFFLHGSDKMKPSEYKEWNNADGTKTKNISIEISVSDEPYQCVASRLPGIAGNKSFSVIVQARPQSRSQDSNVVAIVVPVLVVVGICLSIAVFSKRNLGNGRGRFSRRGFYMPVPEGTPTKALKGPVSKLELWKLVQKANKKGNSSENLRDALRRLKRLSKTAASELQDDADFYESLCEWKNETSSNPDQREKLYFVCCEVGMADIISKLTDYVMDTSSEVSRADIEHILWEIGDTRKINEFFKALDLDHEVVTEKGRREVFDMARKELLKWRHREFKINPLVTLSLKLDNLECKAEFFKIKMVQKEEMYEDEMMEICCQISRQHYTYLLKVVRDNHGEDLAHQIGRFVQKIQEVNKSPFNTRQMDQDNHGEGLTFQINRLVEKNNELLLKTRKMIRDNHGEDLTYQIERFVQEIQDVNKSLLDMLNFHQMFQKNHGEELTQEIGRLVQENNQSLFSILQTIRENHEELKYQIERFVQENNKSLFNTLQMIHDWVQHEECSSYEKRNKLLKAVEAVRQRDHTDAKWPSDDELRVIAGFLSPTSMGQLCSKLDIGESPQGASEEERFQALIEWRDNRASSKDLKEKHTDLFNAFKQINQEGLIPRAKGQLVYKAELVDLAYHLFAQDLLPFTEALGISAAKLVTYKPTFRPSHMTMGTLGLVCKLFHTVLDKETEQRSNFLSLLKKMPYPNVSASGMLALGITCGEMCAISVGSDNCREQSSMPPSSSPAHHRNSKSITGDDTCSVDEVRVIAAGTNQEASHIKIQGDAVCTYNECDQKQSQYGIYNETTDAFMTVLSSTNTIANCNQRSCESTAALENFKVWREQPRLTSFNFRLAIATGCRTMNNYEQARGILQGNYDEGRMPFTFLDDILLHINPEELQSLGKLVVEVGFTPALGRESISLKGIENWSDLTQAVSANMRIWFEKWMNHMKRKDGIPPPSEIAKKHKDFNDKLVDHGFFDLAREIMISEQQT